MSIYEYDEEENYKLMQRQYRNAGLAEGRAEGRTEGRAEGLAEGLAEGEVKGKILEQIRIIIKRIQKNCSPSQTADDLDMDEGFVQSIYQIAGNLVPDYDIEKIFDIYQEQNKTCK